MIKRMDIKEFREKGYLQELNRTFLHPLGLALEISIDEDTDREFISGVWDYREDEEGIHYNLKEALDDRIQRFEDNATYIEDQFSERAQNRVDLLGYLIEEIPKKSGDR